MPLRTSPQSHGPSGSSGPAGRCEPEGSRRRARGALSAGYRLTAWPPSTGRSVQGATDEPTAPVAAAPASPHSANDSVASLSLTLDLSTNIDSRLRVGAST